MRIIDLSQPLTSGMPIYPGDPQVSITGALTVPKDGVAVSSLELGSHSGTHLDAPSHTIPGGQAVDELPLEWLVGEARVLRFATPGGDPIGPGESLTESEVVGGLPAQLPARVLLTTGWSVHFGGPLMLQHPHVSLELARELWQRGARVLGVDALSPDPSDVADAGLPVHDFWLAGGGVIVENLAALADVPDTCQVSLLPLRLRGCDGSPVRAIATVE